MEVQVLSSAPDDISIALTRLAKGSFQIGKTLFSLSTVRFKNNILATRTFSTAEPALILSGANFARFKNCSLVTLSNLLWTHKPSKPFIATLMKNGLRSEQDLEKLTQPVETQYQLDRLKDRQIVSHLGKSDRIVFDGQKLVDAIKEQGIDATFYDSRFGHLGTSVIGILRKKRWDIILK